MSSTIASKVPIQQATQQFNTPKDVDHSTDYPSPPNSTTRDSSGSLHNAPESYHSHSPASQIDITTNDSVAPQQSAAMMSDAPPSPPTSAHSSEASFSPICPSYFYPQQKGDKETASARVLTPEKAPGVPVFEPTWEEFKDFYTFCQRIDEWGMKCGIVKIIPPKQWTNSLPRLDGRRPTVPGQSASGPRYTEDNPLSQIRIKNSIEQIFTPAGSGVWRQSNVVHPARVMNPKQWADICASSGLKGPELSRMKENAKRTEDDGAEEDGVRTRSGRGARVTKVEPSQTAAPRRVIAKSDKKAEETDEKIEAIEANASTIDDMRALEEGEVSKVKLKSADRTTQQEWDDFDYISGWCGEAGQDLQPDDWNPAVCKAIEAEYWRGLNFGKAPMYGADLKGTLFTSATQHWNVGCLDNILTRLRLRRKLPGVTTPYLYFGMWRATFAWHVEDMDLYSINYIHFGAPKQWYAIRQCDRQRFELAMAGSFPGDSSRCRHFMRHKSYLASPAFLASAGIKPIRLVQKAQEFVITYPYGYHSGFNLGFNCAESVNFALESWLDIGRKAGYCDCANDSVKMDVDAMLKESREMEENDRKKEEREKRKEVEVSEWEKMEARRAKERERRKLKREQGALEGDDTVPSKKFKKNAFPCVFCPSTSEEDLVVVPYAENIPMEAKRSTRYAHRLCACFIPETWVATNPKWSIESKEEPEEIVMGFQGIERARWSLKCQICTDATMAKKGAKVQCTYGKCSKTTHVSCALYLSSGWMIDMLADDAADVLEGKSQKTVNGCEVMAQGESAKQEDGQENSDDSAVRIVILCKSHNPKEKEKEARRRLQVLRRCIEGLQIGQTLRVRLGSGVWETLLQEIRWPKEDGVEGEVVADENQVLKWSRVMFDADVIKRAEDEQWKKDEEEAAMMVDEVMEDVVEPVAVTKLDDGAVMQFKSEEAAKKEQERLKREQEKIAQQEAKAAAKEAKEEEKRIKAEAKEVKRIEREAKAVIQNEKRAAREAKAAEMAAKKEARAAELAAIRQSVLAQSDQYNAAPPMQSHPPLTMTIQQQPSQRPESSERGITKADGYDHIRNWRPEGPNARPNFGLLNSHPNMNRELATLDRWAVHHANTGYPPHLATYQSMYQKSHLEHFQPHPAYPASSIQQSQYPQQGAYRPIPSPITNFNYSTFLHQRPHHVHPFLAFSYKQQHPSYPTPLPQQANGGSSPRRVDPAPWLTQHDADRQDGEYGQ